MMTGVAEEKTGEPPAPETVSFEGLYASRYAPMVRLAYLLTGSDAVAEELVQDAFVKVHGRVERLEYPVAYLRTAVVNGCRSWHRRRFLERRRPVDRPDASVQEPDELWDALATLRPRQRAAIVLKFYEDLPEREIADALGVRPGTVKSLVHRGLARLREVVEQ